MEAQTKTLTKRVVPESEAKQIIADICHLAQRCDGAHQIDGAGFNKMDTDFGHEMASIHWNNDPRGYSLHQMLYMKVLQNKYRRQLK
jgi:hypothetical protein